MLGDVHSEHSAGPSRNDRPPRRRRRDRHGRGMRGPLAPRPVPIALTRAEKFDDLASDSVERLTKRWPELERVRFAVLDVPEAETELLADEPVALGRMVPATATDAAMIILYRRPLELRAESRSELEMLVHDILVEQVADLLGLDPETVDPDD